MEPATQTELVDALLVIIRKRSNIQQHMGNSLVVRVSLRIFDDRSNFQFFYASNFEEVEGAYSFHK